MGKNKNKNKQNKTQKSGQGNSTVEKFQNVSKPSHPSPISSSSSSSSKLSSLQQQFAKKLEGSRFRRINEQLYTSRGHEAFKTFQSDPSLFDVYHQGFRQQASQWPHNPLDSIISWINTQHPHAAIADMGCGDARLSVSVKPTNTVHSFDLVAPTPNPRGIIACDIAKTPLADHSVDIVVFCLALMGTNITDFLLEANRILRPRGIIKIAEVRSRFESKDTSDGVKKFIRVLKKSGFDFDDTGIGGGGGKKVNIHNEMFFEIEGRRGAGETGAAMGGDGDGGGYSAKPCIYKRR